MGIGGDSSRPPAAKGRASQGRPAWAWQLRIEIRDIRPPVWRRVLVSDRITLQDLHDVIQDAFGWQDYHLHEFAIEGVRYGEPDLEDFADFAPQDERDRKLRQLALREGDRFTYTYDFGDGWEHVLRIEKIVAAERGMKLPRCTGGKRACPPEDVGGVGGYAGFLEALADPHHPEHREYKEWSGGGFDPEAFDLEAVNRRLGRRSRRGRPKGAVLSAEEGEAEPQPRPDPSRLAALATEENETAARALALLRNVETFLIYLREHKVSGTASTGNLPLKAVAEVCAGFVDPPYLEMKIGEYLDRVRSEDEVWPLYLVHVLCAVAELVSGGPGRRWRLTTHGEQFLTLPWQARAHLLLLTWWGRINWAIACPFPAFGDELPPDVPPIVLALLRELPAGQPVEFEPFVERLIGKVGWTWAPGEPDYTRRNISADVERMVVQTLSDFGVLSMQCVRETAGRLELSRLDTFSLTAFGRALLDALP